MILNKPETIIERRLHQLRNHISYHPESIFQYALGYIMHQISCNFISWTQCVFPISPCKRFQAVFYFFQCFDVIFCIHFSDNGSLD